jgi:glutamate-1-semialdehyde 2,1-aminomutase
MAVLAPEGPVYQAGTLSGNPLATAAGLSVLTHVGPADYDALTARAAVFAKDLEAAVGASGLAAVAPSVGPLVGLFVAPGSAGPLEAPRDYEGAKALAGNGVYPRFFHAMLRRGVALAPGAYEVLFPGLAHDEAVLAQVVEAAADAAAEVVSRGPARAPGGTEA